MPLYDWVDKKTQKGVTIHRDFSKYEEIPTREEAAPLTDEEYVAADWERVIGGGIQVQKSGNWGYGKGYW
jgi:hypothetical protein